MGSPRHVSVRDGQVLVLVGTMKGLFLARASADRARWDLAGPYLPGRSIYAAAYDGRAGRHRIWAGAVSEHWGPGLSHSDDFGRTWQSPETTTLKFPEEAGASIERIWQIQAKPEADPHTLYCGVQPAALFKSTDAGESWGLVRGLWDHPHRPQWQPGFGGLCLHTILPDPVNPERVTVAISTGGVYRTDDGGSTWQVRNRGVRAQYLPDPHPEFGQCVHKVVHHPARPERMFLQNHWGLYRSDDAGDSWQDIANSVPSDFGFAMAVHPHDPETVYIVPLESDEFRCTPEGKLRVYRTRDAGKTWKPLTRGLPQRDALETVVRDAMDTDPLPRAGVYFGTRSGKLYGSRDGGESWVLIRDGLPPIVCVKAAFVGDPSAVPARRGSARKTTAKAGVATKTAKKAAVKRPARKTTKGTTKATAKAVGNKAAKTAGKSAKTTGAQTAKRKTKRAATRTANRAR